MVNKLRYVSSPHHIAKVAFSTKFANERRVARNAKMCPQKEKCYRKKQNIDTESQKTNILKRKTEMVTTSKACSTSPRWKSAGAVSI